MNRNWPVSVRQHVLVPVDVPCGRSPETLWRSPMWACVYTCLLCARRQTPVSFLAVWWRVQCAAGGPGRVSKEGRENQRAGREDPGPGVSGKSIKRNPITLQKKAYIPSEIFYVFFSPKKGLKKETKFDKLRPETLNVLQMFGFRFKEQQQEWMAHLGEALIWSKESLFPCNLQMLLWWEGVIIHARAFDLIKGQSCSSFLFVEALLCWSFPM